MTIRMLINHKRPRGRPPKPLSAKNIESLPMKKISEMCGNYAKWVFKHQLVITWWEE